MQSPALGFAWLIWQKNRVGFLLFGLYLAFLAIASFALPAPIFEEVWQGLTAPFGFGMLFLMGSFYSSDTDLIGTRSGYPNHLFTLPLNTRTLVLWPMVYGIGSVSLVWIFYAAVVLESHGMRGLIWWPATLLATLTACLQSLSWYPVPLPYLRTILAFVVLIALTGLAAIGWLTDLSVSILSIVYLSLIPIAAWTSLRGVTLARTGNVRERAWLPARTPNDTPIRRFTSPQQAQFWLEWKRNGLQFPLLTLLICLLLTALLAFRGSGEVVPLGIGSIEVPVTVRLWLLCLLWAPFSAATIGCCSHKATTFRPDMTLQPFLATRPISSFDLVLTKIRLAAVSTLSAWAILGFFFAGWLFLPAKDGAKSGTIASLILPYLNLKSGVVATALFVGLIIWTWKSQISNLAILLTGRRALIDGYSTAVPLAAAVCIGLSAVRITEDPSVINEMVRYLPRIAIGVALLKGIVIIAAFIALHRQSLVDQLMLTRLAGIWLLVVAGLVAFLRWLLPTELAPTSYIALGVFLFLPLTQCLVAPLALHWNRHR